MSDDFVLKHADFWLDADGQNRWTFHPEPGMNPCEVKGSCDCCGHPILSAFLIEHPTRGRRGVGCECIRMVMLTLPTVERLKVLRAMKLAARAKKAAATKRLAEPVRMLVNDPNTEAMWNYHDRERSLRGSLWWYADLLATGVRKAHFESALRRALRERGVEWPGAVRTAVEVAETSAPLAAGINTA